MATKHFKLAYMLNTVEWDGKKICQADDRVINDTLDIFQSIGISYVMLTGYHFLEPADFNLKKGAARVGEMLLARGMRASQHHSLAATFAPVGESQDDVRDKLKRIVEITSQLQADCVVLHPGRIEGTHKSIEAFCNKYEEQVQRHGIEKIIEISADNIRYAGEVAAKYNLNIALENLDRFEPLGNMELLPKLVEAVNLNNVGYCLDSGHAWCAGVDPVDWIELMGNKLFTTHFHDNHGCPNWMKNADGFIRPAGIDEHLPPGFGTINWFDVINALRKIKYKYAITFESGGWPVENEKEGYWNAIQFWRNAEALAWGKQK